MSRAATDEVDWTELWNKIGRRYDEPQNAKRILNAARALFDDVPDDAVDRAVERDVLERTDEGVRLTGVPEEDTEEDADEDESDGTHPRRDATESDEDGGIYEYDAVPDELKEHDIWLMWDSDSETPRRPHWRGDFRISWSDPDDWHSYEEAVEVAQERESWGIGYVNALDNDDAPREIYGTIDVDGARNEDGSHKDWLPPMEVFLDNDVYVEKSASGTGYHIPLVGYEPPEWWTDVEVEDAEHEGVELLTNKFCAVTGDKVVGSGDGVGDIDVTPWLEEVQANIKGDSPEEPEVSEDEYDGSGLTVEQAETALEKIDADCSYPKWRDIGFALVGEFGKSEGSRLFRDWSRGASKWDKKAEKQVERIVNDADKWDYSAGTVVYHAKQAGWEPDFGSAEEKTETLDEPQAHGDDNDADSVDNWVSKAGVKHVAGLGEDESISDLNDREKAACVWELVKKSDEYHVRVRRDSGTLWAYDDGVWIPEGERTLRHAARQAVGSMNYGENVLNELKSQVRSDPHAEVEADEFGVETGMVAVRNGLLDLDRAAEGHGDGALREPRPDDYALVRLPREYDPNADYDEWHDFVEEWAEEGRADALQEYVGYCLEVGAMPIHRALLLVGGGANGKSTFLSVVRELLGEDNITSTELQTLSNEKDAVADFYGALANIDDDLSSRKLGEGVGMFKKLVAGDKVRGRRLYEDAFEFDATGKHLYAANEVPDVSNDVDDVDEAFWRRWLLVEFPNHYPRGERDPELRDRWTTDEALSAVLNWAIDGRRRLLEQGHFTGECVSAFKKRDRWQSWGDSVDEFLLNHVFSDEDADNVSTGYVHDRYRAWCRENSKDTVGQRKLTSRLKNCDDDFGYARSVRVSDTTGQPNGFKSISFSDKVPEVEEDLDDGQEGIDGFGGETGD
jgi:putative DNA primase/helicase